MVRFLLLTKKPPHACKRLRKQTDENRCNYFFADARGYFAQPNGYRFPLPQSFNLRYGRGRETSTALCSSFSVEQPENNAQSNQADESVLAEGAY